MFAKVRLLRQSAKQPGDLIALHGLARPLRNRSLLPNRFQRRQPRKLINNTQLVLSTTNKASVIPTEWPGFFLRAVFARRAAKWRDLSSTAKPHKCAN